MVNAIVQSPTFSPIRLEARAHWNKYFRTVGTPLAPEVAVTGIHQQQKQNGSGLDTWIKFGQLSFDVATDCKVEIKNLHPDLNGFHQVDKLDPKGLRIAIRASPFSEAQIHEMNSATSLSTGSSPSLKKVCQVDRSKILHRVTVAGITATDVSGMVVEVPTFENLLKQGVSLAVPAPPAASSYQHGFLAHGVSQPMLPGSQQHLPVFPSTVLRSRRQSSPLEQPADWQEAVACLKDTFRTYQQQNDTRVGRVESHAADLAENIVDLSLEVYSCPEKDILDYLIDPEGGETMPDQSRSQETHFSGPAIYATTPAPPPSDATGSVLLTSPTGDLDSLQDAVIKALQQQPNSTPLQISHNVWPRHENPQLESKRRHSMKIAVTAALYRLPSAAFVAQGGTQKKLWSLSPDF